MEQNKCNKCGRPMQYATEPKCNYCDACMSEYCGCKLGRIKEIEPTCDSTAVIPSVTVESVEGITKLANCLVHVNDINTTFYVDDKHRVMITWAGPVDIPGYDMENNPNGYRDQIVTDVENETAVIYDKHGNGYLFGITPENLQTAIDNKLDEMATDGTLENIIATYMDDVIHTFDTVEDMKNSTELTSGAYAQTLGENAIGDGDGSLFEIRDTGVVDNINVYRLENSLYAHRIYTNSINTGAEFESSINDDKPYASYNCKSFRIDTPITLSRRLQAAYKTFSNATITLRSDLFTWDTPSDYHALPNFINCTFIGGGHNITQTGAHILNGRFINCNFINCGLVSSGYLCQSTRFVNCRFINSAGHPMIEAKKVNDVHFINCQCESDNKSPLVNISNPDANTISVYTLRFVDCIFESQTSNIVNMYDGDVTFLNCYTELNSANMVNVAETQRTIPIIRVKWDNCRIQPSSGYYATYIDSSYEETVNSSFECSNCDIRNGALVNTNNLHTFIVTNTSVRDSGTRLPSLESSKIYQTENSIADFSTVGHCIVKKFPCLVTFDSSDGGWHTNMYFVSLSSNNTPQVQCLTDPSKIPTVTYDSGTGYCDVTLHTNRESDENCSAVLLNGLTNDLIRNDYYRTTDGYVA